jgi:carbamoyl-phosphate synthase large subunit
VSVLISSAGRRVALVEIFQEAIGASGVSGQVVAADASPFSAACEKADVAVRVPPCLDPDFIPEMLALCERFGVKLVVPTIDTELQALADARELFAAVGTTVAVSAPAVIAIAADKRRTHRFLRDSEVPTVDQAEPTAIRAGSPPWEYPFIVKPASGSASAGVHVVRDDASFAAHVRQTDVVVQPIAPGREYTVDCLVNADGVLLEAVPRERIEVRAGEVSKGRTARIASVIDTAADVCRALPGPYAVLTIQIFFDSITGTCRVIEINPRFGGGYPLAHRAGADFAGWLVKAAWGLPPDAELKWRAGLLMLRYDAAVFVDASEPER